jgi:hypothetical protein
MIDRCLSSQIDSRGSTLVAEMMLERVFEGPIGKQRLGRDVGGGRLVATVTDLDGNVLGLLQDP